MAEKDETVIRVIMDEPEESRTFKIITVLGYLGLLWYIFSGIKRPAGRRG